MNDLIRAALRLPVFMLVIIGCYVIDDEYPHRWPEWKDRNNA